MTSLPPSAPPGPETILMPDPGPGEVPAAATALPQFVERLCRQAPIPAMETSAATALTEFVEPPCRQAPIPAMETSGQRPQNSTSARPPRLYPPLPTEAVIQQGTRGKNPTTDTPQRHTIASSSGSMGHYHQPPVSVLLPAVFLYGCNKLAETWSTVLGEPQVMIRVMETNF
ncbi:hypothetical protein Celaphus_00019461 [Cervus elaphus hippelaphus]|uniref:Uncharacterized protein n=1 Tax=Cervus elaphus hippelaphus TaxID=46360 RepID=A0A212C3I1_CEREH|nr:hypothetical protein Celaphus_00019461 [Cervus elaphus hippelaphus]